MTEAPRARVAYLVLSHRTPEQVLRLLRRLRAGSPGAALISHHDARSPRLDPAALDAVGARVVEPAAAIDWGTASQLRALLRCLRWALDHEPFDWLVHLSGQDYPLRPVAAIEADLAAAGVDGFIEGVPVGPLDLRSRRVDEFAGRYRYAWRRSPLPARALAWARPVLLARDLPSGRRFAHPALRGPREPLFRGSDWFTLNRRAVAAVLQRADLLRHFDRTIAPTEALPHSVLWNRTDLRLSGDTRRHTVWRPGSPHPETLGLADLDRALASGADFARKFDHPNVLDALDARSERLGA